MGRDYIKDDKGHNERGKNDGSLFTTTTGPSPNKDVYEEGSGLAGALGACTKTGAHHDSSKDESKK